MLVTRVGGVACAIPISHVVETTRPLPIEPLAEGADLAFVRGAAVVRGVAIPVIDTARLLGQEPREQGRFVVVRTEASRRIAMLVDSVVEVRSFDEATFSELPPLLRAASHENVTAIGTLDHGLFVVLDAGRIVPGAA